VLAIWPELAELRLPGLQPDVLRSLVLGAGLAIVFALFVVAAVYVAVVARRARWAMRSGYPAWVLTDVACDVRRDAGTLINGTGDFALVAGPTRHALLVLRRARMGVVALAAATGLAGVIAWLAAWLAGGLSDAKTDVAVGWATAILVTYVLFFLCGAYEMRVRRHERGKGASGSSSDAPPLEGELVSSWLAGAEKARQSLGGRGGAGSGAQ
jgi:uncharacterized membrane protein (DUF485 family)